MLFGALARMAACLVQLVPFNMICAHPNVKVTGSLPVRPFSVRSLTRCIASALALAIVAPLSLAPAQQPPDADPTADAKEAATQTTPATQPAPAQAATPQPAPTKQPPAPAQVAPPQPAPTKQPPAPTEAAAGSALRFSFDRTPWRDVISWLASEADLALHVSELPTGSFTYNDPKVYGHDDAIARVNLFLLPQGFSLVRSGKLLAVINLTEPRSLKQLDALAPLVTPAILGTLRDHDVVKCLFRLGDMTTADAVEELMGLKLMTEPAVFARTNQLMITDTVGNQKAVHAILTAVQPGTLDNGNAVRTFTLQHADAEDILTVVRPHLGLATGESIGIDVSVTSDLIGKNIFVSGLAEKITLIESLINDLDRPRDTLSTTDGTAELRSHRVAGGNVDTVYNVLVTMLAGKQVRLSMDASTSSIVALGGPAIHEEIAQTVTQLQASDTVFEVIQLNNIDPYFAISLLEEMLELSDPTTSFSGYSSDRWRDDNWRDDRRRDDRGRDDRRRDDRRRDDRRSNDRNRRYETSTSFNTSAAPPPKIDADPATRRLFVRATSEQITQIKTIIAQIDVLPGNNGNGTTRLLSVLGAASVTQLETAAKFWREANPIILYASTSAIASVKERVINDDAPEAAEPPTEQPETAPARYLTNNLGSREPPIRCQVTPRGMLLQCDDPRALDRLEELLQTLTGTTDTAPSPPVVFYLKYTKPVDALRMLGELLDGGVTAQEAETGSLVNGTVSTGFYLGSIVTSRDGTATLSAGTITIVADSRLNRLITQGTVDDVETIERYLEIVDKDNGITAVETYGTPHVIALQHTRASDVATVIRSAFGNRVAAAAGGNNQSRGGGSQDRSRRRDDDRRRDSDDRRRSDRRSGDDRRDDRRGRGGRNAAPNREPQMTIAIHEPSNSLIVTAPDQLFSEVEQLVELVDARSVQSMEIITSTSAPAIQARLQEIFSGGGSSSRPSVTTRTNSSRGSSRASGNNARGSQSSSRGSQGSSRGSSRSSRGSSQGSSRGSSNGSSRNSRGR